MSQVKLDKVIEVLKEFAHAHSPIEIILLGGLSMEYYGLKDRTTLDVDGELKGDVDAVVSFLKERDILSDIGENISNWSVVSLPSGYRERVINIYTDNRLKVKVLHPVDFIISKLRRFTEEDLNDAIFVAEKFDVKAEDILKAGEDAIRNSPKDTALFIFRKNMNIFINKLK